MLKDTNLESFEFSKDRLEEIQFLSVIIGEDINTLDLKAQL